MKNLTWQNPEQLFVAQVLINKVKSKCCGIKVYYNWRVEMWAEGRGLLTLKRFHKSMVRGDNNYALTGETISYDDSRLIFEIPEREVTNNPNLQK